MKSFITLRTPLGVLRQILGRRPSRAAIPNENQGLTMLQDMSLQAFRKMTIGNTRRKKRYRENIPGLRLSLRSRWLLIQLLLWKPRMYSHFYRFAQLGFLYVLLPLLIHA